MYLLTYIISLKISKFPHNIVKKTYAWILHQGAFIYFFTYAVVIVAMHLWNINLWNFIPRYLRIIRQGKYLLKVEFSTIFRANKSTYAKFGYLLVTYLLFYSTVQRKILLILVDLLFISQRINYVSITPSFEPILNHLIAS